MGSVDADTLEAIFEGLVAELFNVGRSGVGFEQCVVDDLMRKQDGGCDVTEEVLDVIELAQVAYFSCCVKIYLLLSFGTPKGEGVYVAVNHCTI